jgi:hypothetical protein
VSWWPVIALCGSAYALKALGLVLGERLDREVSERSPLQTVVVPVLAALIVVQAFSAEGAVRGRCRRGGGYRGVAPSPRLGERVGGADRPRHRLGLERTLDDCASSSVST